MARPPEDDLPDSVVLQQFGGLKNTVAPERLTAAELERALNIDLDDTGTPRRRRGFVQRVSGNFHSIRELGGKVYGVYNRALVIIRPDFTTKFLAAAGDDPVCYTEANGEVYFSCSSSAGIISAAEVVRPWGAVNGQGQWHSPVIAPTVTLGEVAGKLLGPPPRATSIEAYKGRIYLAQGKLLWATELFMLDHVNRTRNFVQMEHDITLVMAADDGLYVGTAGGLYFLKGVLGQFELTQVVPDAVYAGSGVRAPTDMVHPQARQGAMPTRKAIVLMTAGGICACFDGGSVFNLTQGTMVFPEAMAAAALFRQDLGANTYVAAVDSAGGPTTNARIGDYVDAEIRRFQGG